MKGIWQLAGLLLLLNSSAAWADKQKIILIGDDDYPPYSYKGNDGAAKGIYADLLRKVGAAMPNFALELQAAPWKRALNEVETGSIIGVYPPYKKPAARPWMGYSTPLLSETVVVVCSKKVAAKYKGAAWPAGFAGLRFGNNAGFQTPGAEFFDMAKAGKLALDEAKTTEQNLRKLLDDRIDCYSNDRRAIQTEAQRLKLDANAFSEYATVGKEQGYIGFTGKREKFPMMDAFIKEFDATVLKLRASGEIPNLD